MPLQLIRFRVYKKLKLDMNKSEYEKMISGMLYDSSDPELVAKRSKAKLICREYNSNIGFSDNKDERQDHIITLFGLVGKNCVIEPPLRVDYGTNIEIGDNFYSNFDLTILDWYVFLEKYASF